MLKPCTQEGDKAHPCTQCVLYASSRLQPAKCAGFEYHAEAINTPHEIYRETTHLIQGSG